MELTLLSLDLMHHIHMLVRNIEINTEEDFIILISSVQTAYSLNI